MADNDRKSEAEIPALISDPIELAKLEASNALKQYDRAVSEIESWIKAGKTNIRFPLLLELHRLAMNGIDSYAGNFRPAKVTIKGSGHVPVAAEDVPRNVDEMLNYIHDNWETRTAIHLSAFVMWRLNWIHPFADGNGRTSRIFSYLVLCGKLNQNLPGTRTIPEQIAENKAPYYKALEAADVQYKKGRIDVTEMEQLLESYLANQLVSIHELATGQIASSGGASSERSFGKKLLSEIENRPVLYTCLVAIALAAIPLVFS